MSTAVHCSLSVLELPGRSEAEAGLRAAVGGSRPSYAVALLADGILGAIDRFGYSAGDRLLLEFTRHWTSVLRPGDRFYRWSGTGFLLILDGENRERTEIEAALRRSTTEPFIGWVYWHDQEIPVALRTELASYALHEVQSKPELVRSIDYFIASNVS